MIKSLFLVCLFMQYSYSLQAQKNKLSQVVKSSNWEDITVIKKQINEREQARLNGDKSVGKRVLARDYISIDETGTLTSKSVSFDNPIDTAVWRQIHETNSELQMKITVDGFQFRFYGKTAIVSYRLYYDLVFNNEPCHKVFQ